MQSHPREGLFWLIPGDEILKSPLPTSIVERGVQEFLNSLPSLSDSRFINLRAVTGSLRQITGSNRGIFVLERQ